VEDGNVIIHTSIVAGSAPAVVTVGAVGRSNTFTIPANPDGSYTWRQGWLGKDPATCTVTARNRYGTATGAAST